MKQKTIKGRIAECLFAAGFFGGMYATIGAPALYAVESILFDSIRDLRKELKKNEEK